jgi:hypothetical protein
MKDEIYKNVERRIAKKKIEIVDILPSPSELPDGAVVGTYSISTHDTIFITYQHARIWDNFIYTETGFTRSFLDTLPARRVRSSQFETYMLARTPLFIKPARIHDAVYVDIVSAYQSLYSVAGWGVEYERGKFVSFDKQRLEYPFPGSWKVGRSYVVTAARARSAYSYIENHRVHQKIVRSRYSNPCLVAFVYDMLSSIALFARELGCVYYNVDGAIMSRKRAEIFTEFLSSLKIKTRVKYEGEAWVWSNGLWRVGAHETLNLQKNSIKSVRGGDWITINQNDAEFLLKRWYNYVNKRE